MTDIIVALISGASAVAVAVIGGLLKSYNDKAKRAQDRLLRQNEQQQKLLESIIWNLDKLGEMTMRFEEYTQKGFNDIIREREVNIDKPLNGNMTAYKEEYIKTRNKLHEVIYSNAVDVINHEENN